MYDGSDTDIVSDCVFFGADSRRDIYFMLYFRFRDRNGAEWLQKE